MPGRDDDVLNVFNENTPVNNNFNAGNNADDELKVLNDNKPVDDDSIANSVSRNAASFLRDKTQSSVLTDEEKNVQEQAALDNAMNIQHSDYDDVLNARRSSEHNTDVFDVTAGKEGAPTLSDVHGNEFSGLDGTTNQLDTSALYKKLLGSTAYEDLKDKCGLRKDESFTDFYNRTHYIPKGFEKEVRMLLVEERRMREYAEYQAGNISKTDFLYNAYGKDLLKEARYDISSKLFWYKKFKNGDFSNPLDNDLIFTNLISNANDLFESEKFYKDAIETDVSSTLQGLVTGKVLSTESVYEIFKEQIDALKPYFDNDINKVITYYQAGSLGNAFSPFIDIDHDGKIDYYYHTNGKMYAVQGSSGHGSDTAIINYNEDNSVHSVEIQEGATGAAGGIFEGMWNVIRPIFDIVAMVDNAVGISAIVNSIQEGKWDWVDAQQDYKAFMSKVFSDEDVKIFDNGHEWGYEVSKAAGTIVGQVIMQVVLAAATFGGGNAAYGAGQVAGQSAARTIGTVAGKAAVGSIAGAAVGAGVGAAVGQATSGDAGGGALKGAGIGAGVGAVLGTSAGIAGLTEKGAKAVQAVSNGTRKIPAAFAKVYSTIQRTNCGGLFNGGTYLGRFGNAAMLGLKDTANTLSNLYATNRILSYYEKEHPELNIKALSDNEIWARAGIVMATDLIISGTMRLQNSQGGEGAFAEAGYQTGFSALFQKLGGDCLTYSEFLSSHLQAWSLFDSAFDIVENMLTMGTMAAMNNPYAALGSAESAASFGHAMISIPAIMQNVYISARNLGSWGYGRTSNQSVYRQRLLNSTVDAIHGQCTSELDFIDKLTSIVKDPVAIDGLRKLASDMNDEISPTNKDGAVKGTSVPYREMQAMKKFGEFFDEDTLKGLPENIQKAFFEAFDVKGYDDIIQLNKILDKDGKRVFTGNAKNIRLGTITDALIFNRLKKLDSKNTLEHFERILNDLPIRAAENEEAWKNLFVNGFTDEDIEITSPIYKSTMKVLKSHKSDSERSLSEMLNGVINRINTRLHSYVNTSAMNIDKQKLNDNYDVVSGSCLSVFANKNLQLKQREDGGYEVIWNNKGTNRNGEAKQTFMKILSDKDAVAKMVELGLIKLGEPDANGNIKLDIAVSDNPFIIITAKPNKVNDIRSDSDLWAFNESLKTVAKLCTSVDNNGERLINIDVPLMGEIEFSSGDGGSKTTAFVMPTTSRMSSDEVYARFESSKLLITAVNTFINGNSTQSDIKNALIKIGLLNEPDYVTEQIHWDGTNWIREGENKDFDETSFKRKGIATLLTLFDVKSNKDTKKLFNRARILSLCSFDGHEGVINQQDLKYIADNGKNIPGCTEVAIANAVALNEYLDILNPNSELNLPTLTRVLNEYANNLKDRTITKLNQKTQRQLEDTVAKLNDPKNAWLKEALIADNNLQSKVLMQLLEDPRAALPFLKGLRELGTSLADTRLLQNFLEPDTIEYKALDSLVGRVLGDYIYSERSVRDSMTKNFRASLQQYRNETVQKFKDLNEKYSHINFDNLKEPDIAFDLAERNGIDLASTTLFEIYQKIGNNYDRMTRSEKNFVREFHKDFDSKYDEVHEYYTKACVIQDILRLDDGDIVKFIDDPVDFLNSLKGRNTLLRNIREAHPEYDVRMRRDDINAAIDSIIKRFGSREEAFRLSLQTIDFDAASSLPKLYKALSSDEPSLIKNTVAILYRAATGSRTFDSSKLTHSYDRKTKEHSLLYDGKDLFGTIVSSNKDISKDLITEYNTSTKDLILKDFNTYARFLYDNTENFNAKNIVTINLIDFIPNNLDKFYRLLGQSTDFEEKVRAGSYESYNEYQKELLKLFDDHGTKFDYQMNVYAQMISSALRNNVLSFDVPLDEQGRFTESAKNFLGRLGYTKEQIIQAEMNETNIPGVIVKNKNTTGINTKINYQDLVTELSKKVQLEKFKTISDRDRDYNKVLSHMFRNVSNLTEDSVIDLKTNGKYVTLYGNFNDLTSKTIDKLALNALFDNETKRGLAGNQSLVDYRMLDQDLGFESIDPISKNTMDVLRIAYALKEYTDTKKNPYSWKNIMFKVPKGFNGAKIQAYYDKFKDPNDPSTKSNCLYVYDGVINGYATFKFNEKFNIDDYISNELDSDTFDINRLIPVWFGKSEPSNDRSTTSPYEKIFSMIDDFETRSINAEYFRDMSSLAKINKTGISIYSLKEQDYIDFVNSIVDKDGRVTVKNALDAYNKNPEYAKNYRIASLINYLNTGLALSQTSMSELSKLGLSSIADPVYYKAIATVIRENYSDFENLRNNIIDNYDGDEYKQLLTKFTGLVNEKIKTIGYEEVWNDKRDSFEYYGSNYNDVTSSSIRKLHYSNGPLKDVDENTINQLVKSLAIRNICFTDDEDYSELFKSNPLLSALSILDCDGDGNAYINLDYVLRVNAESRTALIDSLKQLLDNDNFDSDMIQRTIDLLQGKIASLEELGSIKDTSGKPIQMKVSRTNAPAQVGVSITPKEFLSNLDVIPEEQLNKVGQLLENAVLAKEPYKKFIKASSIYDADNDYSPLNKMMMDMINKTLYRTTDKQGSSMVYNMNSREAVGEFFNTIASFAVYLKNTPEFKDKFNLKTKDGYTLSEQEVLEELMMIGFNANLYSTGTTYDAIRSSSLMIEYDADNFDGFHIKPIITRNREQDRDLSSYMLFGDKNIAEIEKEIKNNPSSKHLMITMEKNAFSNQIGNYRNNIVLYNLDDTNTRDNFMRQAIYRVEKDLMAERNGDLSKVSSLSEEIKKYYSTFVNTTQLTDTLINMSRSFGVSDNVANEIALTVQKLNVAQTENNTQEQVIQQILGEYINTLKNSKVTNKQLKALTGVFIHGITKDALSYKTLTSINTFLDRMENDMSYRSNRAANMYLNTDDKESLRDVFSELSNEEIIKAIKFAVAKRQDGGDLEYMLNGAKSASDYRSTIKSRIASDSNSTYYAYYDKVSKSIKYAQWQSKVDPNKNLYNALSRSNWASYDTEWFIGDSKKLYQLGVIIGSPVGLDSENKYKQLDENSVTRHVIYVKDAFIGSALHKDKNSANPTTGKWYVEEKEEFDNKAKYVSNNKVGERPETINGQNVIVHIVNTEKDAVNKLFELMQASKIQTLLGYNNQSIDPITNERVTDDAWLYKYGNDLQKNFLDGIDNIDVRSYMVNGMYYDAMKGASSDSLDSLRERGIITSLHAHDALSDSEDTVNVAMDISRNRMNIDDLYDSEWKEIKSDVEKLKPELSEQEVDDMVNKILTFDKKDFKIDSSDSETIKGISGTKKNSSALTLMINLYNAGLENNHKNVLRKSFINFEDEYFGNNKHFDKYFNSIQKNNYEHKYEVRNLMYQLLATKISSKYLLGSAELDDDSSKSVKEAYNSVIKLLSNTAKYTFAPIYESITGEKLSNENTMLEFMSQDVNDIKRQIFSQIRASKDSPFKTLREDSLGIKLSSDAMKLFTDVYSNKIRNNAIDLGAEDINKYKNILSYQILQPLVEKLGGNEAVSKSNFLQNVINSIVNCYGKTSAEFDKIIEKRKNNHKFFTSKIDEGIREKLINLFSDEFYSTQALYVMAHENEQKTRYDNSIDTNVIEIGIDTLKKAYEDLGNKYSTKGGKDGKNIFYAQVWRQPGQGRTMHTLKFKVVKGSGVSMSRATARTYFNGDFDGDFYFISKPTDQSNAFGEKVYDTMTVGWKLLDAFGNIKDVKSSDTDFNELGRVAFASIKDDMFELIRNPGNVENLNTSYEVLKSRFEDALKDKVSPDEIKLLWKTYGISLRDEEASTGKIGKFITSSNPFIKEEQDIYNKIQANNIKYIQSTQYSNDYDSQMVGNVAKLLMNGGKAVTSKRLSDMFINSSISLPSEYITFLNQQIDSIDIDNVKSRLTSFFKETLSQYCAPQTITKINNEIEGADRITALDVAGLAQLAQEIVNKSDNYENALKSYFNDSHINNNEELRGKVLALQDYVFNYLEDTKDATKIDEVDLDDMTNPELLRHAAACFDAIVEDTTMNNMYTATHSNSKYRNLFAQYIFNSKDLVKSKDWTEIVDPTNNVETNNTNGPAFGLAESYVAVDETNRYTDTTVLNMNSGLRIVHGFGTKIKNITQSDRDFINKNIGKVVDARMLNSITQSNDFDSTGNTKYQIIKLSNDGTLYLTSNISFADYCKDNWAKVATTTGKSLKGTIANGTNLKIEVGKDGFNPDFVMSRTMFDESKQGIDKDFVDTKKTVKINGQTMRVYKVNNLAILNSASQITRDVKDRWLDPITILQGNKAVDAIISTGQYFYSFNDDGSITYDPTGYNQLRESLTSLNKPVMEEVNGYSELRSLQIYSMLKSMPEELKNTILDELQFDSHSIDDAMNKIYGNKMVGGSYGQSILSVINNHLAQLDEKELSKFVNKLKSDEIGRVVFKKSLLSSTEKTAQSAFDLFDNDGNITNKYFRSKYQSPTENMAVFNRRLRSSLGNRYAAYSNSGIDYNESFLGMNELRNALTEDYLDTQTNERVQRNPVSKTNIDELYYRGLLKPRNVIKGSQLNGFKPIREDEGFSLANAKAKYPELTPDFKTGAYGPIDTYVENAESGSFFNFIKGSSRDMNRVTNYGNYLNDYDYDYNEQLKKVSDANGWAHRAFAGLFTEGSKAELIDAFSNGEFKASGNYDRAYLRADANGLVLDSDHQNIGYDKYSTFKKEYLSETTLSKSTQYSNLLTLVDNGKFESIEALKSFKEINKAFEEGGVLVGDIRQTLEGYSAGDFENPMAFQEYYARKQQFSPEHLSELENQIVQESGDFNQIELEDSFMRSWGFKSKDNKDISLGYNVLNVKNFVAQEKERLGGEEYGIITKALANNKAARVAVDTYVNTRYVVDAYDELIKNAETHTRNLGKDRYSQILKEAKQAIVTKGMNVPEGSTVDLSNFDERLAQLRNEIHTLESNETFGQLLNVVSTLNARVLAEAQKTNPFAILAYYSPEFINPNQKKSYSLLSSYILANQVKTENIDGILKGYVKNGVAGENKIAVALDGSKSGGYYNMITRVLNDLAVTHAMKNLNQYLRSSGYMRNVEVYSQALQFVSSEVENKFTQLSKVFEDTITDLNYKEKRFEYDAATYSIMRNNLIANGIGYDLSPEYTDATDFVELYSVISKENARYKEQLGFASTKDLYDMQQASMNDINKDAIDKAVKINSIYQNVTALMINIMQDNGGAEFDSFLKSVYNSVEVPAGYVLVDSRGRRLTAKISAYSYKPYDVDNILDYAKFNINSDPEAEFGRMMLNGDVFLMKQSVAEQLESKLFTERQPGLVGKALDATRNFVTGFIMSTPLSLVDRVINFTMFDAGTLGRADAKSMTYLPESIAIINKYQHAVDSITPEKINSDRGLQLLLRYMAATGQSPIKNKTYMGDSYRVVDLPGIKQWMNFAGDELAKQQFYMRFAYFMDLVEDGESNDFQINPTKLGVAYHMNNELSKIDASFNKDAYVYKNLFNVNSGKYYDYNTPEDQTYLNKMMALDAAAVQTVAENVGIFGNMPYGTSMLSRMGMMFTGFPLAALRWGKNRIQSLAYAFTDLGNSTTRKYLMNNLGSTALTYAVLLALQVMCSGDTQNALKKKLEGKEDEITEEEKKNMENILFRGGCVKLFDTFLKGEEVTNVNHSRDPISHMFENYVSDFVFKDDEDQNVIESLGNMLKKNIWGHMNVAIKDPIESIPGNTWLQSTSWYEPGDNYMENYGKKVLGYVIGSSQASSFVNNWRASKYDDDQNFLQRIGSGMTKAFIEDSTHLKEYKSTYRNYKKAFTIVSDYNKTIYKDYSGDSNYEYSKDLQSELSNAMKNKSTPTVFYNIMQKYLERSDTSITAVRNTLRSLSLRNKLANIGNVDEFLSTLNDSEKACIKTALAYEDDTFPYLYGFVEDVEQQYQDARSSSSTNSSYVKSISSVLKTYNYNTPKLYRNTNYNNYRNYSNYINFINRYLNNVSYKNKYAKQQANPMQAYNQAEQNIAYGTSKDVWGNEQRHYTDGTTYNVRVPGMPFPGGNK